MGKPLRCMSLVFVLIGALACGGGETEPTQAPTATEPAQQVQANTPVPTDTPVPTATAVPTETPDPTATPEPMRTEPEVLLELEGKGKVVSDNHQMPTCDKAVFYWTVQSDESGYASLIAKLYNTESDREMSLVNEFQDIEGNSITWPALQPLLGGEYYFTTENTDAAWSLRVECQDNMAPVAEGEMNVEGVGLTITDNYRLPACRKSIFNWSVEPNESDYASIIIRLISSQDMNYASIANEFTESTETVMGETLQRIDAGLYYLSVENTAEPWSVQWECRD